MLDSSAPSLKLKKLTLPEWKKYWTDRGFAKTMQEKGIVKPDVDPQRVASFLMSSYQGIMGVTKCMKSSQVAADLFGTLSDYVESLRAAK